MLFNSLATLVYETKKLLHPLDRYRPVSYAHRTPNGELWQVLVTKVPPT